MWASPERKPWSRTVVFSLTELQKLRAPCTKCTVIYLEKITANKADSSCRAAERVSNGIELNELPAKATVFSDRPRGTERAKRINARRGITYLPAETISAVASEPNVYKESSRTQNHNKNSALQSSTFLSSRNPWYTFPFVMEPRWQKICLWKSNILLLDTSTNKQLLEKLKIRILMTRSFLHFWNGA